MSYLSISSDIAKYIKEAIINAWRFLNGQLDSIAYKLLSSLYDFFKELSEVYLYNEKIMQTIGKRIGLVLGIFVLFRLAVALVSYIINPDKLADSSKGTKKIITNIALSLILLGTVNIIFKEAYILQKKIVSSQVIEKMFFGEKAQTEDVDISYYLYGAFVQVNLPECENDDIYNSEEISEQCAQRLNNEDAPRRLVKDQILAKKNIRPILSSYNNINETVDGDYLFDYTPVISLVCAIVAILMLLSSCMDVATRIIKLLFLQIIAPIPIVSNMAPGKGEETFKKWYKECINTYLSLFIRITVISFAIFMISLIKTEFAEIFSGRNIMIQVLLIIGCLIFAKQTPKLIENIFGIKMDGMTLNPLKKFQEQALFGKNITGLAAGATMGTIGAATGGFALQGLTGAFKGMTSGKGFSETWKTQASTNATLRTARLDGSTFKGRIHTSISNTLGTGGTLAEIEREKDKISTEQKKYDIQIKAYEDQKKTIEQNIAPVRQQIGEHKSAADSIKALEDRAKSEIQAGHGGAVGQEYLRRKAEYEKAKNDPTKTAHEIAQAEANMIDWLNDAGMKQYMTEAIAGNIQDASFDNMYQSAVQKVSRIGVTLSADGNVIHQQFGQTKGATGTLERQIYTEEQQIADIDRNITTVSGQKAALNDKLRDIEKREIKAKADQSAVKGK